MHDVGYNLRMANINASIGYNQLCNLKKTLSLKKNFILNIKNAFQR